MKIVGITDIHGKLPKAVKDFKDFADVLVVCEI